MAITVCECEWCACVSYTDDAFNENKIFECADHKDICSKNQIRTTVMRVHTILISIHKYVVCTKYEKYNIRTSHTYSDENSLIE